MRERVAARALFASDNSRSLERAREFRYTHRVKTTHPKEVPLRLSFCVVALSLFLVGCDLKMKKPGSSSPTRPSLSRPSGASTPRTPEEDYQERLRFQFRESLPPTTVKYAEAPWGSDGNPQSAPSSKAKRFKILCIADNISEDYAGCGNHATASECGENDNDKRRCEYVEGQCRPWTQGECETLTPPGDANTYKKIIFLKEYLEMRRRNELVGEFANYDGVKLYFEGHGPWVSDLVSIAKEAVAHADRATFVHTTSHGCTSFSNLEDAKREIKTKFTYLHEAAMKRLPEIDVLVTGNQFHSIAGSLKMGYVYAEKTNSPATLKIALDGDKKIAATEHAFYACKSALDLPATAPERLCSKHDQEKPIAGFCWLPSGTKLKEHCKDTTLFYRTGSKEKKADLRQLAVSPPATTYTTYRGALTFAEVQLKCAETGARVPSYSELKTIIEWENLSAAFSGEAPRQTGGWIWSSSPSTRSPGWNFIYSFDELVALRKPAAVGDAATAKGNAMCIKTTP